MARPTTTPTTAPRVKSRAKVTLRASCSKSTAIILNRRCVKKIPSSILRRINSIEFSLQIVLPAHSNALALSNGTNGYHSDTALTTNSVRQKVESLMTEEETIVEERKQYRFTLGRDWDSDTEGRDRKKRNVVTTAYATIHPPLSTSNTLHEENLEVLVCTVDRSGDQHLGQRMPVDMPVAMNVPDMPTDNIYANFDKPGVREAQDQAGYGARHQAEECVEIEFVEPPPRPESPPRRPDPICAACSKAIQGRCITAMMRKFHPEHFVCSYCLKVLNKGTFKEREDKPYCQECFYRLFG